MNQFIQIFSVVSILILSAMLVGCSSQSEEPSPSAVPMVEESAVNAEAERVTEQPRSETVNTEESELSEAADAAGEEAAVAETDDEFVEEDEFDEFDEFEAEFEAATPTVNDPFEGYNRAMTVFNDKLYFWVLNPIASGYAYVVPEAPRRGVRNFFHNLLYPIRLVNNVLQLKFKNAGEETLRFVTNSTIGILGFWDPANKWFGLEPHEEDFGQTLGYYGIGAGPHIVLPFFGPSNLRDSFSMYPDKYLDPVGQEEPIGQTDSYVMEYGVRGYEAVNEASLRPGEYESIKKDAVDFYAFLRDGYEQMRIKQIKE